jgi:putative protease
MPAALPELLAPAGSFDAAVAAFRFGADAVYAGLPRFSARADAENLDAGRLRALVAHARSLPRPRKVYVAFNTLAFDSERAEVLDALADLEEIAPDALIVQDLGVARLARRHFPSLELHASTQLAAHSVEGVRALGELGFTRVVLARECTLDEVARIVREGGAEIEVFVHGALCHSVSGLCLHSAMTQGRSGNRGRCAYCCRIAHGGAFPFSMRDLALAPVLDRVVATGAASLKIEGRMKGPLYVACATDYYRRLLDGALSPAQERELRGDLRSIFAREWTTLYALGEEGPPEGVVDPRSLAHRGEPIGRAEPAPARVLRFRTERRIERHDGLLLKLPAYMAANDGHPFGFAVGEMRLAETREPVFEAPAGALVELALPPGAPPVPAGETVYLTASQALKRRYEVPPVRESALEAGRAARFRVALEPDGLRVRAADAIFPDVSAETFLPSPLEPARDPARTAAAAQAAFAKLGGTAWRCPHPATDVEVENPGGLFAPAALLNAARRDAAAALSAALAARRESRKRAILADAPAERPTLSIVHCALSIESPRRTLKFRIDQTPDPATLSGTDRIVLAIGHAPLPDIRRHLERWQSHCTLSIEHCALSLPALCRDREAPALEATLDALIADGWRDWEAADLAGARRLRARGIAGFTVDGTTLPAANRDAVDALVELGAARICPSAETPSETLDALACARPGRIERLVRQSVPLFIACTAPVGGGSGPLRRFEGRPPLLSYALDDRWITIADTPPWRVSSSLGELAPPSSAPIREDYSWDAPGVSPTPW